jgi:hypothetical protein
MVNLMGGIAPILAATATTLLSARGVEAHGHHAEDVPEGQYTSAEPIVC